MVHPQSTHARLQLTLRYVCNLQAASEATLTDLDGVHLMPGDFEYLGDSDEGEGSLARFTALRSLYLRQAHGGSMIFDTPSLPRTLRCADELTHCGSEAQNPDCLIFANLERQSSVQRG